jgi:hypothetical protein
MLKALNDLVESRIEKAVASGDFDNLPGAGRPLALDTDPMVPEELRAAYRVLKNAGFVPPEVEKIREAADLRAALVAACDELAGSQDNDTRRMHRRLAAVSLALQERGVDLSQAGQGRYYHRSMLKLAGHEGAQDRSKPFSGEG